MGRDLAAEYERRFPGVEIPDAQKEERMERLAFKREREQLSRSNRLRGIVVPPLPLDPTTGRLKP